MNDHGSEHQIRAIVTRIAHAIDARRWDQLRALYADTVVTDYTSLFGGEVVEQSGDALIEGWRRVLGPLDATQHLVGPIEVQLRDGGAATVECHVRGYHLLEGAPGGPEWMVAGHWVIGLSQLAGGWKITGMTLQTFYQTGNRQLLEIAGSR